MVLGRIVAMSLFGLMVLSAPAWAGQALLVKGMEAQKAGRNAEALKLLNEYVDRYPQVREARYYRALEKLTLGVQRAPMDASPATAHMFIVNPLTGSSLMNLFSTHPPLEERVARLRAMRSY